MYVIGEDHNHSLRTTAHIHDILKKKPRHDRVAIVTELGMCQSFHQLDERIVQCIEEPEKLNILSSVVSLMASLCHYDTIENKLTFDILLPKMIQRGYIPMIGEVKTTKGRVEALRILFQHIETLLQECAPRDQHSTYSRYIKEWLQNCTNTTSSMSLANDLRDRWLVNKAKEITSQYDHVIVIAGIAHIPRLVHLLGAQITPKNVYL